jgi:hypothetical protein
LGAARVYGCLNPDSQIRGTTSAAFDQKVFQEAALRPDRRDAYVMDAREARAMSEVTETLRRHPGATVYILYGGAHQFGPEDFASGDKVPLMRRIDWPGLELTSPAVATGMRHELHAHADLQALLLERAPSFYPLAGLLVPDSLRGLLQRPGKVISRSVARPERDR